jgi:hypothetical protein
MIVVLINGPDDSFCDKASESGISGPTISVIVKDLFASE